MEKTFSPLIERAIELAAEWHAGTYRKGRWRDPSYIMPNGEAPGIPVISHVTAVAITVQKAGWDDPTVAAAFLHDILEDPNQLGATMSYDQLSDHIGNQVAQRVFEVSEIKQDKEGLEQKWKVRKVGYLERLSVHSAEAAAISLADKIHNLWSMNETLELGIDIFKTTSKRKGLSAGPGPQLWFYNAVYKATLHHKDQRLVPMQQQLEDEIERFERLTGTGQNASV